MITILNGRKHYSKTDLNKVWNNINFYENEEKEYIKWRRRFNDKLKLIREEDK
jgi:hypothetical protein